MTRLLLALLLASGLAAAAAAQAPPSRTQAQAALDMLRDDTKRAQLIAVLEAIVRAAPLVGQPPAAPAAPANATPADTTPIAPPPAELAPPPPEEKPLPLPLAPDSVGAQIITGASENLSRLSADILAGAGQVADFPSLGNWLVQFVSNPDRQQQVLAVAWRQLLVLAAGLVAEAALRRALRRPARALARAAPGEAAPPAPGEPPRRHFGLLVLHRLPYSAGHFLLDVLPLLLLGGVGYGLAGTKLMDSYTTRLVVVDTLQAYVAFRLAVAVMRFLVAPATDGLRLLPVSSARAGYMLRWTRRLAALVVFSYAAAEIGLRFGLYRVAYDAFLKLVSLVLLVCLVTIVLQVRGAVATLIHAPEGRIGTLARVRNRLARLWHIAAIFYLGALWLVWALELPNGFARLLRVVVSTIVVVTLARLLALLAYGALDRALPASAEARQSGLEARLRGYQPVAHALIGALVTGAAAVALFESWGVDALSWFTGGALGSRIVGSLGNIFATLVISLAVWEASNAAIQRHLARLAREAQAARSARLRTLLPMLRTTLLITLCTVAGLMILSEIGVNIAPLLAGAGVVGLAIGFGSQKLVQDIITGLFLLLENTMQVGDVVSLGGMSGTVEALSIRTIRLRALDGSVHIVPFSAVTTVTNQTRDFGYAVVDVSVGLNEDPAHVADVLRAVAKEMRREPRWESAVRDELDVMGVEKFLDTAMVLRTRIKTVPGQRWAVGRELNRRFKSRFDELAIESPWTSFRVLGSPAPVPPAEPEPEPAGIGGPA